MTTTDDEDFSWEEQDRKDARTGAWGDENSNIRRLIIPGAKEDCVVVMFDEEWDAPRLLVHVHDTPADNDVVPARVYDLSGATVEAVADEYDDDSISDGTREEERLAIKYNGPVDNICIEGVAEGSVAIDYDEESDPRVIIHTTPSTEPTADPYLPRDI